MSCLSWNCRGLGNPRPVRDFHGLVKNKKTDLVFLMETKSRAQRMKIIKVKLGFGSIFTVDCMVRSGGLALHWNDEFDATIKSYSRRHSCGDLFWKKSALVFHGIIWPYGRSKKQRSL
jgi:hypothetical protein